MKDCLSAFYLPCLSIIVAILHSTTSQEAVGCGGFIKSGNVKLTYQRISIQLTLPDGTLRYVTDVLPNGAYSIPVYEPGEYVLKVQAPEGWGFEPLEGHAVIVGGQDSCRDDYNFQFSGFTVIGQVITKGLTTGPSGLYIELKGSSGTKHAVTQEEGVFSVSGVLAGKYSISVVSQGENRVKFERGEATVTVDKDNVRLPVPLMIKGFRVIGGVTSDGQPIKGVHFILYSGTVSPQNIDTKAAGCLTSGLTKEKTAGDYGKALCETISDADGRFQFSLLPGGAYTLMPLYRGEKLVFDVQPEKLDFEVTYNEVDLGSVFQVAGFSVSGRVLYKRGADRGVTGAKVLVNGKPAAVTDSQGRYHLDSMKSGRYSLEVSANLLEFSPLQIDLTPNSPHLPDVIASKFAVCGRIVVDRIPQGMSAEQLTVGRSILLADESGLEVTRVETKGPQGEFCAMTQPGVYSVRPLVTQEEERAMGLRLAPLQTKVKVIDQPVSGLTFSQFRALVSGQVACLETCPTGHLEVTLSPEGATAAATGGQAVTQHIKVDKSNSRVGRFQFADVMPGQYRLDLQTVTTSSGSSPGGSQSWCWKATNLEVAVVDKNVDRPLFEHSGYSVSVVSSHPVTLTYKHKVKQSATGQVKLEKGSAQVCLPVSGEYVLTADSCHRLRQAEFAHHTAMSHGSPIQVIAAQHQVKVSLSVRPIKDAPAVKDIRVVLKGEEEEDDTTKKRQPIPVRLDSKTGTGEISVWVKPGEVVRMTPHSAVALFSPTSVSVSSLGEECAPMVERIAVELGVFVSGSIRPSLKGVNVTVVSESTTADLPTSEDDEETTRSDDLERVSRLVTDAEGKFKVGPLSPGVKYTVTVEKAGYNLVLVDEPGPTESTNQTWSWRARKLAEVLVVATEEGKDSRPLQGVLLSVVGDDYRGNELTDEEGKHTFLGLNPGTYYVRAMMKEYDFKPSGAQTIKVEEGKAVRINVKGSRSAYSAFGMVTSLTGDPESGLTLEAREVGSVSPSSSSKCTSGQITRAEQANTDEAGKFRIRGLIPGCHYIIALKLDSVGVNQLIERSVPSKISVDMTAEDRLGFKLYAFRRLNMMEISALVRTPSEAYLSSLRITVFPLNNPDHILVRHNMATDSLLFTLVPPTNNGETGQHRSYVVRLESNLSPALYSNISAQEVTLTPGNGSGQHFVFHFYPAPKVMNDQDLQLSMTSLVTLPLLLVIVAVCFMQRETLVPYLANVLGSAKRAGMNQVMIIGGKGQLSTETSDSNIDPAILSDLENFVAKPGSHPVHAAPPKKPTPWGRSRKT